MHKTKWSQVVYEKNLSENFRATSLDSLANSSNQSESLSDESHDSDSGAETKSKNSFTVKCEVYSQNACGSIRSWSRSESGSSDRTYDYASVEEKKPSEKRLDSALARMETIPEENEPKVSVKAILARFENLKGDKDCNNNYSNVNKGGKVVKEVSGSVASACSSASSKSSSSSGSKSNAVLEASVKEEKKVKKETKAAKEVKKLMFDFKFIGL